MIDRGKISKTLSDIKPIEIINKNPQSFLELSLVQKEDLPSHKLGDHAYEYQNQLSHPGLSHTEQECQEFDSRKDSQSTKFERRPQIFVKLSFRELCDSKLSGLHAFDNIAIIH